MTIKNKPDRETLYHLYVEEELSPIELSEIYNCHSCTITVWIKGYNIHFRNRKESHNTKRILKKRHDNIVGDKNPTKRDSVRKKMSDNQWLKSGSIEATNHIESYIKPRMRKNNPMFNPEIAQKHGIKISEVQMGIFNPNWKGGLSFEEYPREFFDKRIYIRKKYNNCDYFTGIHKDICDNRELSVHHIDYNKSNNNEDNLIPLCSKNHLLTNNNRYFWYKLIKYAQYYDNIY